MRARLPRTAVSGSGSGFGSSTRIESRLAAETTNEIASASSAYGAVTSWTSRPPRLGPPTWATEFDAWSRLFAPISCSRETTQGTNEYHETSKTTVIAPKTKTSTTRRSNVSRSVSASVTIVPIAIARPMSTPISSGSRRTRSASAPTHSVKSR